MEQSSTVSIRKSQNKPYLQTGVPKDIGVNALGLKLDVKGQRLVWKLEKGKVVVKKGK